MISIIRYSADQFALDVNGERLKFTRRELRQLEDNISQALSDTSGYIIEDNWRNR